MDVITAVVTGGSKGIGLEIVRLFVEKGFEVVVCSRSLSTDLRELIDSCEDRKIHWYSMDLGIEASVNSVAKDISKAFKVIDVLVNCAGAAHGSAFLMTRIADFKSVFEINYFHALAFTQIIAKKMLRRKQGSIVNIVSTAGFLSDPGTVVYGGSKAALIHATKVLAAELGSYGIRVNAVAPAIVNTEMGNMNDKKMFALSDARSSLSGVIEPEDVAFLVYFLACKELSSKISGQVYRIDRGIH